MSAAADDLIRDIIRDAHSGRERTQDERVLAGLFGAVMVRARDEYDGEADLVIATLRAAGWRPPAEVPDPAAAAVERTREQMQKYSGADISMVSVRQVINLLSPTWPDGNFSTEGGA